jgi:hypothetical protein
MLRPGRPGTGKLQTAYYETNPVEVSLLTTLEYVLFSGPFRQVILAQFRAVSIIGPGYKPGAG